MLHAPDKRLALQAYEEILKMIEGGEARPGDLVTERRLADSLNMSRTPVRDALLMLESEGLLIRQGSRGLQVKQMRIEEYMDALQIRLMLEPRVARMAAGKVPHEEIQRLTAALEQLLAKGKTETDRAVVRELDENLHSGLARAVGNPQLAQIIQSLRRQTQMFDLRAMPERFETTCREHLKVLAAVEAGDGEAAEAAMTEHIVNVQDSIIGRLTRR
ncbi:GntR family transcriptional regulator [Aquamicrobium sp. LC103]|uniref:GntR family transcriptional regulator n=1 Tax=Aquamicrobium sp. LC103 TaxID=1120658 RepID=UPI00063EA35B|nr:GntR family transcriptional regulator [Aquamicrobium sp. LC103]TKT69772.1 GntR family transcriptional regulator [Aquamicrobium sp. LC103]